MDEAAEVLDYLAAGDRRARDVILDYTGLCQKLANSLGDGPKVASSAGLTRADTCQSRLGLRLRTAIQRVNYRAVDVEDCRLQCDRSNIDAKKQFSTHETALLQKGKQIVVALIARWVQRSDVYSREPGPNSKRYLGNSLH